MCRFSQVVPALVVGIFAATASAMPKIAEPVPLNPENLNALITIYPDDQNPKQFWLVPNSVRIVERDGRLRFGLVHSGISGWDPDGIRALVTMTVQPYVDESTLKQARDSIKRNVPDATFSFVSPKRTEAYLLIRGTRVLVSGKPDGKAIGGTIDAGLPIQILVNQSFDVRSLAQAAGANRSADVLGVDYEMFIDASVPDVAFEVTADLVAVGDYVAERVSKSSWWGLSRSTSVSDWKDFKEKAGVEVKIIRGTTEALEKYHLREIQESLLKQAADRTGMFQRTVPPPDQQLPVVNGGMIIPHQWGWAVAGWGTGRGRWEAHTREERKLVYTVDASKTIEHSIEFGTTFDLGENSRLRDHVKNLTDTNKPWPSSDDFLNYQKEILQKQAENLALLNAVKSKLSPEVFDGLEAAINRAGPYIDMKIIKTLVDTNSPPVTPDVAVNAAFIGHRNVGPLPLPPGLGG